MSLNRTAKGIVLVPSLLLGGAFLAAAAWSDGPAGANKGLALALGGVLMGAGLLAQLLPESAPELEQKEHSSTAASANRGSPRNEATRSQP